MDPFSLSALTADALTSAITFLFDQGAGILRRWRDRKQGKAPSPDMPAPPLEVRQMILGELQPLRIDYATAGRLESDIRELRRALSEYEDGSDVVDPDNRELVEAADALRRALEAVYSQRITFVGEDRPPSCPFVQGEADVDEVEGYVSGVRARVVKSGQIAGSVRAKRVAPGGEAVGIDVDTIG